MEHVTPDGRRVRVARSKLDEWIRAWRAGGFEALLPKRRVVAPRTDPEVLASAEALKREVPARTAAQVCRVMAETGTVPTDLNTQPDWSAFRLTHLGGDDAVSDHEDATVRWVRTAEAVRSCVIDDYVTTVSHHRYHEVACYVTSGFVGSVVVAATPSGDPGHVWTQLERAVAAYPFE